jgi:hypothetical protein
MHRAAADVAFTYLTETSDGNPAASPGVTVNLGASNADHGTPVALIGTPLTHDVELLEIFITSCSGNAAATDSSALVDILIDPAGGTSWDTTNRLITSLMAGMMTVTASDAKAIARMWRFPLWIPAGATIGANGRSIIGSAQTATVMLRAYGGPSRPGQHWCGTKVDAIGEDRANSSGTSLTPNSTSNTYGSFASFGSATARRYQALIPSITAKGTTVSSVNRQTQIGIGGVQIGPSLNWHTTISEQGSPIIGGNPLIRVDVPEGTQLQARSRSSGSSSSADQMIIHGIA